VRKLISRLSISFALLFVLLTAIFSLNTAQETPTGNGEPKRDSVSITVYNQGTALVKDRRTFTFAAGENQINFTDVASTIDATSVNFKSLTDPETYVIEQNYAYDLVDTSALLAR
jgi:hypothetical protein